MPRTPETAPPPGPSPFARGPTGMSGGVTVVLGLSLLGLLFAASLALPAIDRALAFERAPESVARVFERRLELAAAMEELPAWESAVLAPFVPVSVHTPEEALMAFRAVVDLGQRGNDEATPEEKSARELELDGLRARRAALLAGRGRLEEAQGDLDELGRNGHATFVTAIRALSSGRANPADLALAGDGWIGKIASARARKEAPPTPGDSARKALTWARGLAGVVGLGALVLLGWLARNRPEVVAGSIAIPSPWTPQTGFGVLVRAAFLAVLILAGFQALREASQTDIPVLFQAAAASVPLLYLARKHLARPNRLELLELIGLPAAGSTVLIATIALFALDQIGGRALATAATGMGATEPWTFQVDEFLLWSGDAAFAFSAFDSLAFGVLAQELAFRGILFPSLRHVHGPIHAAVLAGLLFSAVHLASLPTMLALAWSGFIFAASVERTRSLLPAILCAVLGGLFETGLLGALYR